MVTTNNFLSDTVIYLKSLLNTITDPLSGKRNSDSKFILTEYPNRLQEPPYITITDDDISHIQKIGMSVEQEIIRIQIEIRVWARNVIERDNLSQQVINKLRDEQYPVTTSNKSLNENLYDLEIPVATTNLSELGKGIKSKIIWVAYKFELGA